MRRLALAALLASMPFALSIVFIAGERSAYAVQKPKTKKEKATGAGAKKVPRPVVKESKPAPKAAEPAQTPPEAPPAQPAELRGPTRIDFDDRLIQGQTNKSGAVYLFDRKETGISSMVRRRKSFRSLTLGTIYDR